MTKIHNRSRLSMSARRLAALTVLLLAPVVFSGNAAIGQTVAPAEGDDAGLLAFNGTCGTCHTIRDGDNRLGPTLHKIIGRKSAAIEKFSNYSPSMKQANIVWDEKTLDAFIANPEAVVPGHGMQPYAGTSDAGVRTKIIGFLKACESCGPGCPAPKKCTPATGPD